MGCRDISYLLSYLFFHIFPGRLWQDYSIWGIPSFIEFLFVFVCVCMAVGLKNRKSYQPMEIWILIRDLLIWQIEEFLYPTSILSVIYHIRADAFRFFGPWCFQKRAIQPVFGVKLLFLEEFTSSDWITFRLHKSS